MTDEIKNEYKRSASLDGCGALLAVAGISCGVRDFTAPDFALTAFIKKDFEGNNMIEIYKFIVGLERRSQGERVNSLTPV